MSGPDIHHDPPPLNRAKGNRTYLYRQLADRIRAELVEGVYQAGERLPSMDKLADHFDVNKVTVIKAIGELRDEGWVHSIPAKGTYVADPPREDPHPVEGLAIGLISHALHPTRIGPYHAELIAGISDRISRTDGHLVLLPAGHLSPQDRVLDLLTTTRLQAAIYLGPFEPGVLRQLVQRGPPAVLIDDQKRGVNVDTVNIDNQEGGRQAMEHLLQLGHRQIACITGRTNDPAAEDRLTGARLALHQSGIEPLSLPTRSGEWDREGGFEAARYLLQMDPAPTALCCQNDEMAVGAIQAIQAHSSRNIPGEVSVIGFDDISWASATHPPLTTIRVDKALIGTVAVEHLLARLADPGRPPVSTSIGPQPVVRGTTSAAPR